MKTFEEVKVNSCKFDGRIHRSWNTRLRQHDPPLIVLEGIFAEKVQHKILGTIPKGTLSTEYFWTDRWYAIFCFHEKSGEIQNFYCNINTPANMQNRTLSFIDLDIDVLVKPDFSFQILDMEEFQENALLYKYPPIIHLRIKDALKEIISLIEGRRFPFHRK